VGYGKQTTEILKNLQSPSLAAVDLARKQQRVAQFYIAFLNRVAEKSGLDYWVNNINSMGEDATALAFYNAVFGSGSGGLDGAALITQYYRNLFNDTSDTAGINYWASKIAVRGKGGVLVDILNASSTVYNFPPTALKDNSTPPAQNDVRYVRRRILTYKTNVSMAYGVNLKITAVDTRNLLSGVSDDPTSVTRITRLLVAPAATMSANPFGK
jgi:hypothetical protein